MIDVKYLTFHTVLEIIEPLIPPKKGRYGFINDVFNSDTTKDTINRLYNYATSDSSAIKDFVKKCEKDGKPDNLTAVDNEPPINGLWNMDNYVENLQGFLDKHASNEKVREMFDVLIDLIENAISIHDIDTKKELWLEDIENKDFATLYTEVLYYSLSNYSNLCPDVIREKLTKPADDPFVITLQEISQFMLDDIYEQDDRYHMKDFDVRLIPAGYDVRAPKDSDEALERLLPRFLEDSDKNPVFTGEGGVGKTTICAHTLKSLLDEKESSYIPFYIPLAALKKYYDKYEDDCILKYIWAYAEKNKSDGKISYENTPEQFLRLLKEYLSDTANAPKILLLLDGINEISLNDDAQIRKNILEIINKTSEYPNVRLLLTTRHLPDMYNRYPSYVNKQLDIEITGIPVDEVNYILSSVKVTGFNKNVTEILRVPLFLRMFLDIAKNNPGDISDIASKGAILYKYCNSESDIYNDKMLWDKNKEKLDTATPDFFPILSDFLFPAVAFHMLSRDSLDISLMDCSDIYDDLLTLSDTVINNCSKYDKYKNSPAYLYTSKIKRMDNNYDVINEIVNRFTTLLYTSFNNNYSFTHQYIRDYYAAIFYLNALMLPYEVIEASPYYKDILSVGLPKEVLDLMYDIIIIEPAFKLDSADLILKKASYFSGCPHHHVVVKNLLELLERITGHDYSSLTIENVDLSKYSLRNVRCTNTTPDDIFSAATFKNCKLSPLTLQGDTPQLSHNECYTFVKEKPAIAKITVSGHVLLYTLTELRTNVVLDNRILKLPEHLPVSPVIYSLIVDADGKHVIICTQGTSDYILSFFDLSAQADEYKPVFKRTYDTYDHFSEGFAPTGEAYILNSDKSVSFYDWDTHEISTRMHYSAAFNIFKERPGTYRVFCIDKNHFCITFKDYKNTVSDSKSYEKPVYKLRLFSIDLIEKAMHEIPCPAENVTYDYTMEDLPVCTSDTSLFLYVEGCLYEFDILSGKQSLHSTHGSFDILAIVKLSHYIYLMGTSKLCCYNLSSKAMAAYTMDLGLIYLNYSNVVATDKHSAFIAASTENDNKVMVCKPDTKDVYFHENTPLLHQVAFFVGTGLVQVFENGFISLCDKEYLNLINTFSLPGRTFLNASFDPVKNLLSVVSVNKYKQFPKVHIFDTSASLKPYYKTFDFSTDIHTAFSSDGRYLFIKDSTSLWVWDFNKETMKEYKDVFPPLSFMTFSDRNAFIMKARLDLNFDDYCVISVYYSEDDGLRVLKYTTISNTSYLTDEDTLYKPTEVNDVYSFKPRDGVKDIDFFFEEVFVKHNDQEYVDVSDDAFTYLTKEDHLYALGHKSSYRLDLHSSQPVSLGVSGSYVYYDIMWDNEVRKHVNPNGLFVDAYTFVDDKILYASNAHAGVTSNDLSQHVGNHYTHFMPGIDIAGCKVIDCEFDEETDRLLTYQAADNNRHDMLIGL